MTWFRVDQSVLRHPKMVRAIKRGGDGVVYLWLGLGTWSSEHLTDGIVPIDMLDQVSGPSSKRKRNDALRALIDCGLVHETADGSLELHDFLDYNPAAEVVKTERERWAQSKRKHRLGKDVPPGHSRDSREESTPCPAVPSPSVSSPSVSDRHAGEEISRARDSHPESDSQTTGIRRIGVAAASRVVSLPSLPPREYLERAKMDAIPEHVAKETWRYWSAKGLPLDGVDKPIDWVLLKASLRKVATAHVAPQHQRDEGIL